MQVEMQPDLKIKTRKEEEKSNSQNANKLYKVAQTKVGQGVLNKVEMLSTKNNYMKKCYSFNTKIGGIEENCGSEEWEGNKIY